MATANTEHLVQWLREAYAMEEQAEQMLGAMAGRADAYPDLRDRLLEHRTETKEQLRLIGACLDRYKTSASALTDWSRNATAFTAGLGDLLVSDEVVKRLMAAIAFEHMEVAVYSVIVAAARQLGDNETAEICSDILMEKDEMAAWLEEQAPDIVEQFFGSEPAAA